MGTFSDAVACPKVNLRAGDPDDEHGFIGLKPECASSECNVCGFGKDGGIPYCKALETSEPQVRWTSCENLERPGGKKTLPKQLCDLWADFKKHSRLYMAHHSKAK